MKTYIRLVECTDYNEDYGILVVDDVNHETVQKKIYEIKHYFNENDIDYWTIDDLLNMLPNEWNWKHTYFIYNVEV